MFKKGTKLYSILHNKCPKCHEGDFMKEKNIFKLQNAFKMHESCSNCGLKYMMEPSFFYGAMYVNYGLTVGLAIATFAISVLFFNLTLLESFIPIVIVLLLTTPITIRLSRIIWINIFVHFDKNATKRSKSEE
ncbi:DUF983 domain-containing protein [Lutibacter maritimus]|jgi:uncharacterized protein (DUF983 family)|uniref:Uncharacterized conserved protein, DUF983 family n=1 Tax=Lutibacter maritimus TaxID=593133 RepID=A0A1I6R3Y0_9FLAO|nr:DUF983 domain-containing protein [Lutibacter maritimus]SFS59471.1 Uncharacterized conserved protein, DUF983 family [Lutibacter maritimus]